MEAQNLKQRAVGDHGEVRDEPKKKSGPRKDEKRKAMAKHGLRSLAVAVLIPVLLILFDIFFFGSGSRSGWRVGGFPPLWLLHMTCLASTFFMGLSAWLVWAEDGFHKRPAALGLYLGQLGLSLAWYPIVLWAGASRVGLVACLGMFGALIGCLKVFREVNPIAGDLVKPCLAWAAIVSIVNLKFAFW